MFLGKWTKLALAFVSVLFAIVALIAFNNYLGLFLNPCTVCYNPCGTDAIVQIGEGVMFVALFMFALASLYFARDLYVSRDKIFKPHKSTLIAASASFFTLSLYFLVFIIQLAWPYIFPPVGVNSLFCTSGDNTLALATSAFGTLFGLIVGKILLNEYFGLKWHERATPHVMKKIRGRR
ncbi:Uncharacterised protein [Candidatus Norongarragalina meridionalis]|nr:Uncharacterised protein [Candidatus Norongarragalina meridionalis]